MHEPASCSGFPAQQARVQTWVDDRALMGVLAAASEKTSTAEAIARQIVTRLSDLTADHNVPKRRICGSHCVTESAGAQGDLIRRLRGLHRFM
jgi:hypothetical protein